MSAFVSHMAARAMGTAPLVQARAPALFETSPTAWAATPDPEGTALEGPGSSSDSDDPSLNTSLDRRRRMNNGNAPPSDRSMDQTSFRSLQHANPSPLVPPGAVQNHLAARPHEGGEFEPNKQEFENSAGRRRDRTEEVATRRAGPAGDARPSQGPFEDLSEPEQEISRQRTGAENASQFPLLPEQTPERASRMPPFSPYPSPETGQSPASAPPVVRITIGRLEVRSAEPPREMEKPARRPSATPRAKPPDALDAYLKSRAGRTS